jgi:hypothetical protein
LYHSIQVDRCWQQRFYGDSVNHTHAKRLNLRGLAYS